MSRMFGFFGRVLGRGLGQAYNRVLPGIAIFGSAIYISSRPSFMTTQEGNHFKNVVSPATVDAQPQEELREQVEDQSGNGSQNDIDTPTSQLYFTSGSNQKKNLRVFCGTGNRELSKEIVAHLDIQLSRMSLHQNTESETQIEILDSVRGQQVYVIQTLGPPHVNSKIIELNLICSALKRSGAAKVTCIIPYFGYSRQTSLETEKQRRNLAGSDVCRMLESMGCDQVVTINYGQQHEVKGFFSPRVPLHNINVNEMIVPYLLQRNLENPVLISAHLRSRDIKKLLSLQKIFEHFEQTPSVSFMLKGQQERVEYIGDSVRNRDCVIFGNIIDSGKSLSSMAQKLHDEGARRIFWFSPHGLFTENSQKLIKNSYIEECIVTNTVEEVKPQHPKIQYISVAKILAEVVSVLHSGQSLDQFRKNRSLIRYYSPPAENTLLHHALHHQHSSHQRSQFTFHL